MVVTGRRRCSSAKVVCIVPDTDCIESMNRRLKGHMVKSLLHVL